MRTDGIDMAPEAVHAARDAIKDRYGAEYVPGSPRMYKNKAKNAQEAHECIRPTDMTKDAQALKLTEADQRKLYDLIWKRTLACQMEAARLERTTVEIGSADGQVGLRATGRSCCSTGSCGSTRKAATTTWSTRTTSACRRSREGETAEKRGVTPEQHFTQPPPRYTEATLVKRMEELGIGRPSTYASIVTTIQDRGYVRKDRNRLIPEDKGRLVTAFLENYFRRYVGYDFTADPGGGARRRQRRRRATRRTCWAASGAISRPPSPKPSDLRITEVLEKINEVLEPHLFPPTEDGSDPRLCPNCGRGGCRCAPRGRAARSSAARTIPNAATPAPSARRACEDGDIGPDGKLLGDDAGDEIRLVQGPLRPLRAAWPGHRRGTETAAQSVPKGWALESSTWTARSCFCRCRARSARTPKTARWSRPGSGATAPTSSTASSTPTSRTSTRSSTIGMNRAVESWPRRPLAAAGAGRPQSRSRSWASIRPKAAPST